MSNLKEQVNKTAMLLNDIKSALEDQGVDTSNMTPKDYANAIRGVVNNITIDNISLIPVLIFKYSENRPDRPDGGSWNPETGETLVPEGWYTDIGLDYNASNKSLALWMSNAVFSSNGDLYKKWSTPIRISGRDGQDGKQGPEGLPGTVAGVTQFFNYPIFYRGTSDQPDTPWAEYDPIENELQIQNGWTETIERTDNAGVVYWQSYVKYNTANMPPATCTTPIRMTAESSAITGNIRYYQLSDNRSTPVKGTSLWNKWTEDIDIAPTKTQPYLFCYDETIYGESRTTTSPVYLMATYTLGLLDIDIAYAVGQENTVKKRDGESDSDYNERFGKFWFTDSVEAISVDKEKDKHPDDDDFNYYPGLTERTMYLWCRETFEYNDHVEQFYRIISYYKAAEKAPVLYSAGIYSDLVHYTRNDEQCPYVFYPTGLYLDESENVITKTEDGKDVPVTDNDSPTNGKKYQYFFLKNSYENNEVFDSFYEAYLNKKWKKIDSFEAIYSDIGIFKSALVGKFVFDDKYLFSQFGKDGNSGKIGQLYTDYTDTKGKVYDYEQGVEKDRTGVAVAIEDPNATKKFIPATLINAVTGESWFGNGTTKFYSNGEGDLANGAIGWRLESGKSDPTLYIDGDVKIGTRAPKPGAGPLESKSFNELLSEQDEKIKSSIQEVQDQIDGVIENWNGIGAPSIKSSPTSDWIENENKNLILLSHINDTYINVGPYESTDSDGNIVIDETAGQAWRWCQCGESEGEGSQQVVIKGPLTQGEWVKVGQLDMSYNYNYVVSPYGKAEFAYDHEIMILSGPPTYIKVDRSGAIYLFDDYGYFVGANSSTLLFEYADYTIALDEDGNLIKLHWHKIADSDAVRALKEATEATRIAKESATPLNLLANSAELVIKATNNNTYKVFGLPITVSTGDTFTFKAENIERLAGTINLVAVRILSPDLQTAYSDNTVELGKNKVLTFKITAAGISNANAVFLLYAGGVNNTTDNTIRYTNFSLVKGSVPMPMWQDYQGDNGLKNLLSVGETFEGQFTAYTYYGEGLPITVNAGEKYTFHIEDISMLSGTDSNGTYYYYLDDFNSNLLSDTASGYINQSGFGTITIREGVSNAKARFLISKNETSPNSATVRIKRMSLVKGTRPMMVWKGNDDITDLKNTFGSVAEVDGVSLSKAVAVKNSSGSVTGILNGGTEYTACTSKSNDGTPISFASGVNKSTYSTLKDRVSDAKFIVYDTGSLSIGGGGYYNSPTYFKHDGSGRLANGNIKWDTSGNVTFKGIITGSTIKNDEKASVFKIDNSGITVTTTDDGAGFSLKDPNGRLGFYVNSDGLHCGTIIAGPMTKMDLATSYYSEGEILVGSASGIVHISGGKVSAENGFFQTSDKTLKIFSENISIDFDKLKQIPKKYFYWKDRPDKLEIGTSAQDVQKLYPEIVNEDSEGMLSVDYSKLSIIALAAIDKLHEENIELKNRLTKLEELYGNRS